MFRRDEALPFIEARTVQDGRKVCYAKHWHETFSIGLISRGRCNYINRAKTAEACVGTVVLMNPGDVYACNHTAEGADYIHLGEWQICITGRSS